MLPMSSSNARGSWLRTGASAAPLALSTLLLLRLRDWWVHGRAPLGTARDGNWGWLLTWDLALAVILAVLGCAVWQRRARQATAAQERAERRRAAVRAAGAAHVLLRTDRDWLPELARCLSTPRRPAAPTPGVPGV